MTAFVLGATGFVGHEVVRQLCVRGTETVAHVRPDSSRLAHWHARFGELGARVDTTAWDATALAARLREVAPAQLYILIGTTRSKAKTDAIAGDIYEQVDLRLTELAVAAARASECRPRLVYLSAAGANPDARGAYMRARGKAQAAVTGSGLPWAVAQPAIITGDREDGRPAEHAAAVVGDGLLAVAGVFGGKRLRAKWRSTTGDVLASALIRIGEAPEHDRIYLGDDLR